MEFSVRVGQPSSLFGADKSRQFAYGSGNLFPAIMPANSLSLNGKAGE